MSTPKRTGIHYPDNPVPRAVPLDTERQALIVREAVVARFTESLRKLHEEACELGIAADELALAHHRARAERGRLQTLCDQG